jgi:protein-S-isoprenylcysteine O-methyltransferase Ste14
VRIIAVACLIGAALCAVYDVAVKHVPLNSWHLDIFQVTGWVLVTIGIVAAYKIKPKGTR